MGVDVVVLLFDVPRYERELLPAYRSFMHRADSTPLVSMLERAVSTSNSNVPISSSLTRPQEVYQEYADILQGRVYYNSKGEEARNGLQQTSREDMQLFVERSVAPALLRRFCVPQITGFTPEQDLSTPRLTGYLYEHSRWIEDHFTFAKEPSGPTPEITLGEWSRLLSREEVQAFKEELDRLPAPSEAEVAEEFTNLRALVNAAAKSENLGLLMCVF